MNENLKKRKMRKELFFRRAANLPGFNFEGKKYEINMKVQSKFCPNSPKQVVNLEKGESRKKINFEITQSQKQTLGGGGGKRSKRHKRRTAFTRPLVSS